MYGIRLGVGLYGLMPGVGLYGLRLGAGLYGLRLEVGLWFKAGSRIVWFKVRSRLIWFKAGSRLELFEVGSGIMWPTFGCLLWSMLLYPQTSPTEAIMHHPKPETENEMRINMILIDIYNKYGIKYV